jgi:hypothetical protein
MPKDATTSGGSVAVLWDYRIEARISPDGLIADHRQALDIGKRYAVTQE